MFNSKRKILFVLRTYPFPAKGGDLVVFENITKALKELGIEFDLLCFDDINGIKKDPKINLRCIVDWIFKKRSYIFNRFYSKKLSEKLMQLVKSGEYSSLVFEHAYMYVNVLFNPNLIEEIKKRNIKTIINTHVMESFVFEQTGLFGKELEFLKNIEHKCIKHANRIIFLGQGDFNNTLNIFPEEKEKFKLLEMQPFIENYPYSHPEFEEKNSVYFLGTFSWIQNHDAVMYFVKEIFPLVLKRNPEVKFYLVGKNAGNDIKNLHDGKNIFFVGEKENIFEEIKKYSILINPLRIKGGTSLKILESIAWGKAVITTSSGLAGINTYGETPVLIADTPQDFAEKIIEILNNEALKVKIKEHARIFAEKHYFFESFKETVTDMFVC